MSPPLYNWLDYRTSGVLLHISSLPSETGIGNFGPAAYRFIDFMEASGIRIWQICPLGPTGYGDSPYQSLSAFAGNPYFIDLKPLLSAGLIKSDELDKLSGLSREKVDYGTLHTTFWPILPQAYNRFKDSGADELNDYGSFKAFRSEHSVWIEDFGLFMALKSQFEGSPWLDWPENYRDIRKAKKLEYSDELVEAIESHIFYQYLFFRQLEQLRNYAKAKGIQIFGDIPIFVALDSVDVWANPTLFLLDNKGKPNKVAGVPPDYFSKDGQLWGNPLYDWKIHQETQFKWWIDRIKANLRFYDIIRLDHFRGFESYWSVPAKEKTARNGEWVNSPGLELFKTIHAACPKAKLVAEDLGVITDKVNKLRKAVGLPKMAVLHFAFGDGPDNPYLPHNYSPNTVVYSGTHDNDTTLGWYHQLDTATQDHVRRYLSVSGNYIGWDLTRAAIQSTANIAIMTLQDLMSLGSEARFNQPGKSMGNWQWRYLPEQLNTLADESSLYLKDLLKLYGRI